MTANPSGSRSHLSVPKSEPSTSASKVAAHSIPPEFSTGTSRSSSHAGQGRGKSKRSIQADLLHAKNDKATAALIRRVLCPHAAGHGSEQNLQRERGTPQPLEELLPPLTSSNDVDFQLYALIAVVIKEFVYAWYSRITPDSVFGEELIQVVAHCTRALEQRLRRIDVHALVLDEIPGLLEAHILAYRTALQSPQASRSQTEFRAVYHTLNPHRALSPVPDVNEPSSVSKQSENENMYRQLLAQAVLAVLLPTEDLENVCLRTLVGDILADLVLGEIVGNRVCQGWFLWEAVTKLISESRGKDLDQRSENRREKPDPSPTDQDRNHGGRQSYEKRLPLSAWLFRILQYCYFAYVALRFLVVGLFRAASTTSTFSAVQQSTFTSSHGSPGGPVKDSSTLTGSNHTRLPVVEYRLFGVLSQLIDVPRRMPWLGGILALAQHQLLIGPGNFGQTGNVVDRFLRGTIDDHLLKPSLLPRLLLSIRATLFPSNTRPVLTPPQTQQSRFLNADNGGGPLEGSPNPAALPVQSGFVHPSENQIQDIKRACATSIASLVPHQVALAIFRLPTRPHHREPLTNSTNSGVSSKLEPDGANHRNAHSMPVITSSHQDFNDAPVLGTKSESGPEHDQDASVSALARGKSDKSTSATNFDRNADPASKITTALPAGDHGGNSDGDTVSSGNGSPESLLASTIEEDVLDLFSDSYCNKHLVFSIIEAVIVKVIPELADRGVSDLMSERGL